MRGCGTDARFVADLCACLLVEEASCQVCFECDVFALDCAELLCTSTWPGVLVNDNVMS